MTDLIKLHSILINLGEVPRVRGNYMFLDRLVFEFSSEGDLIKVVDI